MTVTGERPCVLVVDDDRAVRRLVRVALEQEGFGVDEAGDADEAMAQLAHGPAVVLLDLALPGPDGFEVLRSVREATAVPVILLTGRASELDRVQGLDLGADDYVVKPFLPRELGARVRAVLRRATRGDGSPARHVLRVGDLVLDGAAREASIGGVPIPLTRREFALLAHLAGTPRRVFSRDELLAAVWPASPSPGPETVTEHIRRLRRKLGDERGRPRIIRTVRGAGYRLDPPRAVGSGPAPLQLGRRRADHPRHLPG